MHRANFLYDRIAERSNLELAFWKAIRGKRGRTDVQRFTANLDLELDKIADGFANRSLTFGNYHYFTINDPKTRLICATSFHERVAHHAIMNVLEPTFEARYIHDSFACRKNRGTHGAVLKALAHSRYWPWYLKLDVRKYFDSISHEILLAKLQRVFKEPAVTQLFENLLDSYEVEHGRGLPIGNLTSQHFANFYLSFLDTWICQELKPRGYVRYMDDFVLWGDSETQVRVWGERIEAWATRNLKLTLKPADIGASETGVAFLGFLVKPKGIYLTRRTTRRTSRKFRLLREYIRIGGPSTNHIETRVLPVCAHLSLARSRFVRNTLLQASGLRLEPGESGRQLEQ